MGSSSRDTSGAAYTQRLERLSQASWKRWLGAQAPYRWHLRRLGLGFTLDVGCGIGRNLLHLDRCGVGVDANPHSVEIARGRGCSAFTSEEFASVPEAVRGGFDGLLFSHVLEHMTLDEAVRLVGTYLPYLRAGGRIVIITPQEAGFRSDPSHVEFMDHIALRSIQDAHGLTPIEAYSFPFPRFAGRFFRHNEFVIAGLKRT